MICKNIDNKHIAAWNETNNDTNNTSTKKCSLNMKEYKKSNNDYADTI